MRYVIMVGLLLALAGTHALSGREQPSQDGASSAQQAPAVPRVDLNVADQSALEALPGIGPRTAELIIEYRNETGGFKKVEELMNIRGIGERTFLRLRELVRIGDEGAGK